MSLNKNLSSEEKLRFGKKFLFGIGNLGGQTVAGIFATSLIIFYREKLLLQELYIAWAFILYAIWNAINDPLFGWISDKTKTKWGRRIPYLRIFTPLLTISFILVWLGPTTNEAGQMGVFIWLLLTMLFFDTAYTAIYLVYLALAQEIRMDHVERANLQVFAMIFGLFGTFLSLVLPLLFLGDPGSAKFILLIVILAIIQLITMTITAFTVKERIEFSKVDEPLKFIDSFKETLKNKSFLITVSMNFCMIFVQSVVFGGIFFYVYYVMRDYDTLTILLLFFAFLISGIIVGYIYILKINKIKGLKVALIRSLISLGIGLILVGTLPGLAALAGMFFVGIGFLGAMTLVNTAFGEIADEDEVNTGTRREAAIFGINAFITKPAQSVAGVFIALILLLFAYQEPINGIQQAQSDFTIFGLKLAIGIIPGLVVLCGALIFKFYPLHGKYLADIKTTMHRMHDEKKEKFKSKLIP